jgi:hypothetical protein
MGTQRVFDRTMPSPDEIQAAIRRAHHERSQAFGRLLGALFSWRREGVTEPQHAGGIGAAACR